jgi:FkbH-like protein
MVAVPELPEDVADYPDRLGEAGYFEAVAFTAEDAGRARQYALNNERMRAGQNGITDIDGFLCDLRMVMQAEPFRRIDLKRVTQLTNKTNQFNLTTQRYTETDIERFMVEPTLVTLQLRLTDRFGDNGLIAVIIARPDADWPEDTLLIDTWLMSCRVLGRQVEVATLESLVRAARASGWRELVGIYRPTAKNSLVADHYAKLGFRPLAAPFGSPDDASYWGLELVDYAPQRHFIEIMGSAE